MHRPTIRIRGDELAKYRSLANVTSGAALATRMGVHADTVHRTLSGRTQLTVDFIAALLGAFPELSFGDLFAVDYAEAEVSA
jgi:transcriptional regulator with XRE-family HTH domain